MMDVETTFDISHPDFPGTKRAVMIGINYVGQQGELAGCHNDVLNMKEYLMDVHGFEEDNIVLLMDDGENIEPTRDNIMDAYAQIVADSEAGDVVYLHYSGKSNNSSSSFICNFVKTCLTFFYALLNHSNIRTRRKIERHKWR